MTREEAIIILTNTAFLLRDGTRYMKLEHEKQFREAYEMAIKALEQPEQPEPCELCSNLEKGDTLYQLSDWDGGIGFDYIRDIQYCPMCGRRLKND